MNLPFRDLPLSEQPSRPLAPSLEPHRLRLSIVLIILDTLAIYASFLIAGQVYLGEFPSQTAWLEASLLCPLALIFGLHGGLYSAEVTLSIRKSAWLALYALAVAAITLIFITFYAKATAEFSRGVFTIGCGLSFLVLVSIRSALSALVTRMYGPSLRNTIIINAGGPDVRLEHAFYVDAREQRISSDATDPVNLDRLGRCMANMDRVIVSCSSEDRDLWVPLLRAAGVQGEFVSDALRRIGATEIKSEAGFSTIVVSMRPLGIKARFAKRLMDLTISSAALLLLAPLMLVVTVLIKLEDGGPVMFKQRRMGRGNRFFRIYKFRSMRAAHEDADGLRSTSREDHRVTRIGKFIRRTSIDELPQLYNVWRGEMSMVGPRPHALGSQAGDRLFWEIDGRYWNRHALKPGLTGLAQIKGHRGATEFERDLTNRLQADLEYVEAWSIWLDVKILLKTARILIHRNAY